MFDLGKVEYEGFEGELSPVSWNDSFLQINFSYDPREGIEDFVDLSSVEVNESYEKLKDFKLNPDDFIEFHFTIEYVLNCDGSFDSGEFFGFLYAKNYDCEICTVRKVDQNILTKISKFGLDRLISDLSKLRNVKIV